MVSNALFRDFCDSVGRQGDFFGDEVEVGRHHSRTAVLCLHACGDLCEQINNK